MSKLATLSWGPDQFRVGPWNADERVAYLAVAPSVLKPTVAGVERAVQVLANRGFIGVTTAALRPTETSAFSAAGFHERERLVILRHDLRDLDQAPMDDVPEVVRLVRPTRRDRSAVIDIDHAAFTPPWWLDAEGLEEALRATPRVRFRVASERSTDDWLLAGYSVIGRSDRTGYVQRLAVHPDRAGRGLGRMLLANGLEWLRRRGATSALVNTQGQNQRALNLYLRAGFTVEPYELTVMERAL